MLKIMRRSGLIGLLLVFSLALVACGDTPVEVPVYTGATPLTADQAALDAAKNDLKSLKDVKIETYAFKDDPAQVKAYYQAQYKDKGWADQQDKVADLAKQQQTPGGWVLVYEKNGRVVSLVATPASTAGAKFPNAQGENVLSIISGSK